MAEKDELIHKVKTYVDKFRSWKRRVLEKKISYYQHLVRQTIRGISFKTRDKKIEEFDEILHSNSEIYFTTDLVKTGFTDQLIGFSFLYKLGLGLGLKYHHTRLSSHRSSVPFLFYPYSKEKLPGKDQSDIFDFLGLNSFLKRNFGRDLPDGTKEVKINMEATLFRSNSVKNYETLIDEMKVILHPFLKNGRTILITFECSPITYFKYYKYVASKREHELDFRQIFRDMESENQFKSFKENTKKVMVHIRQGDTGVLKTPWNTFIPTWYETKGKYTQFQKRQDISHRLLIDVDEFYRFLKDLLKQFDASEISAAVFSDGFKKTFRAIYQSYKVEDISHKEISKLKEIESTYDEQEFQEFRMLPGVETVIGEEVEKLYKFIHSFMEAEILICGTQGIMIPKFLATYGDRTKMPLMIMLYKTERPYLNHVGFNNSEDFMIFVDIENYDIDMVSKQVKNYFNQRDLISK